MQYFSKKDEYCHDDAANVWFPDSVYRERLESLPRVISLPYNKVVRDCIDLYADRRRNLVRYMLGMADFYFPIIEQVLDEHDLPIELKYLAVVESALNPVACHVSVPAAYGSSCFRPERFTDWRSTALLTNVVTR